jgi:hypothetical protein
MAQEEPRKVARERRSFDLEFELLEETRGGSVTVVSALIGRW